MAIRRLWITDNPALTSIDPLSPAQDGALAQPGQSLIITGNLTLSQCVAEAFLQSLLDGGWLGEHDVTNNGPC